MAQPTLLLTRPAPQSRRFAAAFAARHPQMPVLVAPLMRIEALPLPQDLAGVDGVILTSENAVAALAPQTPLRPPAWCVGARTEAAARAAGFPAAGMAENAAALTDLLKAGAKGARLLHARGRHVASDFPAALASAGITVTEAMVYEQSACPLTEEARALLARPGAVLAPRFLPPAPRFCWQRRAAPSATRRLHIAAISPAVARAAEPLAPLGLDISYRPAAGAMLDALGRLIATLPRPHGA